ncbi:MAG: hypothetical protein A2095_11655 [Sphingomonadales bacterium GWF1_63_6]|nr:MAG: hypothetical protein A2095_11655 [Sphingomonadales bacterium GWF1_63_6]
MTKNLIFSRASAVIKTPRSGLILSLEKCGIIASHAASGNQNTALPSRAFPDCKLQLIIKKARNKFLNGFGS